MDSALTPREIQDRIRAGASVAEVASEAGAPEEWVAPFAGPVLAERSYLVEVALTSPVRSKGEAHSHRSLRTLVTQRLQARGLDAADVSWDAWRLPDRRWRLQGLLETDEATREAWFTFDLRTRASRPSNADATWMIDEPTRKPMTRDEENTVDLSRDHADDESPDDLEFLDDTEELDLADYAEAELEQIDDLYDIVGPKKAQMDVLYDMLSGISEDSVRIYTGLIEESAPIAGPDTEPEASDKDGRPRSGREASGEAEQDPLVEGPETPRRKKRGKRASVPSWDEIMFGSPHAPDQP